MDEKLVPLRLAETYITGVFEAGEWTRACRRGRSWALLSASS